MLSIKHQVISYLYDINSTKDAKRNKLYSRDWSDSIRTSPTTMVFQTGSWSLDRHLH